MFRRLQFKMSLYYTLILIAILLITNLSIYFLLQTYNNYQLSNEMSSLITGISGTEWIKESVHEPSPTYDDDDEDDDEEASESLDEKASEVIFSNSDELVIPVSLNNVSFYFIYNTEDKIVKWRVPSQNLLIPITEQLPDYTIDAEPQVVSFKYDSMNYYLVMKLPIVVGEKWYGYFYAGRDVTVAFETLNNLRQILIVSLIACVLISLLLGYLIAGRTIRPIKEAYETKQRFLADASHELRTPLSIIMLSTEVLLREIKSTEELKHNTVNDIKREAKKMTGLVENLLLLARTDNKGVSRNKTLFDFSSLVSTTISSFKYPADEKQIIIDSNVEPGVQLYGDVKLLSSVISILLDNAVKYTQVSGNIIVSVKKEKSRINFIVEDNGPGIASDELDKIFDRFYRQEASRSRKTGGYGLGLSIAKKIVENHSGNIYVSSSLGKGSIFKVILDYNQ